MNQKFDIRTIVKNNSIDIFSQYIENNKLNDWEILYLIDKKKPEFLNKLKNYNFDGKYAHIVRLISDYDILTKMFNNLDFYFFLRNLYKYGTQKQLKKYSDHFTEYLLGKTSFVKNNFKLVFNTVCTTKEIYNNTVNNYDINHLENALCLLTSKFCDEKNEDILLKRIKCHTITWPQLLIIIKKVNIKKLFADYYLFVCLDVFGRQLIDLLLGKNIKFKKRDVYISQKYKDLFEE